MGTAELHTVRCPRCGKPWPRGTATCPDDHTSLRARSNVHVPSEITGITAVTAMTSMRAMAAGDTSSLGGSTQPQLEMSSLGGDTDLAQPRATGSYVRIEHAMEDTVTSQVPIAGIAFDQRSGTAGSARPPQGHAGQQRQRILRIGVLLGGKIVEERLIRERTAVSIGQSMKNTFSIPVEGLPLEFTLFAMDQGRYYLRFLGKMDGRVSDSSGQVHTLDALKGRGAQQVGEYWQVPLSESSRGKLSFGDLSILFQFVTEPPRQPKAMLPASVRGTIADRIDPRLAVILGISILLHFSVVIWAYVKDLPVDRTMAERAYNLTFKQDTYIVEPPVDQPPVKTDAGSAAGSAAPVAKPEPKPRPDSSPDPKPGGAASDNRTTAQMEDEARAIADFMTGEGTNGTTASDLANRRPGGDIGQQIKALSDSGKQVTTIGDGRGGSRDGGRVTGTGSGTGINAPGQIASAGGGKADEQPKGRISVSDKQTFDDSTLTADLVLQKIQSAYMAGLKRCYKTYLAKDASARGKVTLTLTVNETGRTTASGAKGFASDVDACIEGLMGNWRFAVPKDKDGEPTEASFQIALQFVPD